VARACTPAPTGATRLRRSNWRRRRIIAGSLS